MAERDWVVPVALVGGGAMLLWGAKSFFEKKEEEEPGQDFTAGDIVPVSVVYNNNLPQTPVGQRIPVSITWRNDGDTEAKPKFRVDMKHSHSTTPREGDVIYEGSLLQPGQSETLMAYSNTVPTNWADGQTIDVYIGLMEKGAARWSECPYDLVISNPSPEETWDIVSGINWNNGEAVMAGEMVAVSFTLRNNSEIARTVNLRVTLKHSSKLTWFGDDQQWVPFVLSAGQELPINIQSPPTPTDWGDGSVQVRIMLEGIGGAFAEMPGVLPFIGSGGGLIELLGPVVWNNGSSEIQVGNGVRVQFSVRNIGTAAITPEFRITLKNSDKWTWYGDDQIHPWYPFGPIQSGQTVPVDIYSPSIPVDWTVGSTIHVRIMHLGTEGALHEMPGAIIIVEEPTPPPPPTPTLACSYNETRKQVDYSYQNFQPNSRVRLTIQETGGYLDTYSDSEGSGAGSFDCGDPGGTYTLKAQDEYGNYAVDYYTVSGTIVFPDANIWYASGHIYVEYFRFTPNAQIRVGMVETGGYLYTTSDNDGHGTTNWIASEPPGTYHIRVSDESGRAVTKPVTIT